MRSDETRNDATITQNVERSTWTTSTKGRERTALEVLGSNLRCTTFFFFFSFLFQSRPCPIRPALHDNFGRCLQSSTCTQRGC